MRFATILFAAFVAATPAASAQNAWPGSYPEGPVWIGETLYWAEMYDNRVMAWSGGEPEPFFQQAECGPTAIARYREDELIVLCHLGAALAHLDRDGKLIHMIRATPDGGRLTNPNDATSDGDGGVWFTDPGVFSSTAPATGEVFHLAPDGELTRHADSLHYGNGVHTDLANRQLLVSEHLARRVLAYPLEPEGLGQPKVIIDLDDLGLDRVRYAEAGPDGLEIGPDGTLWVAEYGAGRLLGWRAGKGLVAALQVDAQFVTNIAFGPNGLAAMTGAKDNRYAPFPGATWVFPAQGLTDAVLKGEDK
ncbi:MAG: SMP-30/gluconolactonase/LRE family protein [Pseudomonadota bacterium]